MTLIDTLDSLVVRLSLGAEPKLVHITHSFAVCLFQILQVMGDLTEFERAIRLVVSSVDFDRDITVNVFETTIRTVRMASVAPVRCDRELLMCDSDARPLQQLGGLLSAHLLADRHLSGDNCTQLLLSSSTLSLSDGDCSGYQCTLHQTTRTAHRAHAHERAYALP
jgi:hypothetical protein